MPANGRWDLIRRLKVKVRALWAGHSALSGGFADVILLHYALVVL